MILKGDRASFVAEFSSNHQGVRVVERGAARPSTEELAPKAQKDPQGDARPSGGLVFCLPTGLPGAVIEIATAGEAPQAVPEIEGFVASAEVRELWGRAGFRRGLADALVSMRGAAGLSQRALAARMGKDAAFVNRMEAVTTPEPKAESIALYARACGFRANYLFLPEGVDPDRQAEGVSAWVAVNEADDVHGDGFLDALAADAVFLDDEELWRADSWPDEPAAGEPALTERESSERKG